MNRLFFFKLTVKIHHERSIIFLSINSLLSVNHIPNGILLSFYSVIKKNNNNDNIHQSTSWTDQFIIY